MVKYDTRSLLQSSSKLQRCFKEMLLKISVAYKAEHLDIQP